MNSMYCAEQINIPPELGTILKQFTKAVIRERPENVYKFSANFFASLAGIIPPFDQRGELTTAGADEGEGGQKKQPASQQQQQPPASGGAIPGGAAGYESVQDGEDGEMEQVIVKLFNQYDSNANGRIDQREMPALLADLRDMLGFGEDERQDLTAESVLGMLDVDNDGTIDLNEFKSLFFQSS